MTTTVINLSAKEYLSDSYVQSLHTVIVLMMVSIIYLYLKKKKKKAKLVDFEFLYQILDNLPFPIFIKDIKNNFRFIFWNKTTERLTGVPREYILGKTDFDLYPDQNRAREYRKIDEEVVAKDELFESDEDYLTKDGRVLNSIMIKSIIKQNHKNKWLLSARWDVTQIKKNEIELLKTKKEMEIAIEKQNLALKSIDFGLVYIDKDFVVQWESTNNVKYLGVGNYYKPSEVCYRTAWNRDEPCEDCPFKIAMAENRSAKWVTKWGDIDVEIVAAPTYSDNGTQEITGGILRIDDITEKIKFDKALQNAKEKAEESNRLKSAFLANMSHEIRTPLNAIIGFSGILSQTDNPEEKEEFMKIISQNNELLLQLINDILDLSKIEAGTLDFSYTPTKLHNLLENIYQQILLKENSLKIEFRYTEYLPDLMINIDRSRLSQVVINFLTNAFKFTKEGTITLGFRLIDENEKIYLYVKDTGMGIPADKVGSVFDRFIKLNNHIKGTGLGLSISRIIIENMGGTIGVNSIEGKGSEFWFIIPVNSGTK